MASAWMASCIACLSALSPAGAQALAVKGGTVLTMTGPPIENGWLLVQDGKIVAVGAKVRVPEDVTLIDATGKTVVPGLVAAFTTLAEGARPSEWTASPEVLAVDGFDTFGDYRRFLAGGVTAAYVTTSQQRLISGQGAVVKLGGEPGPRRIVKSPAALQITLGELPKNPPGIFTPPIPPGPANPVLPEVKQLPSSRLSQGAMLRKLFAEARRAEAPTLRQRALLPYAEKRLPVRIRCGPVGDVRMALRLARELGVAAILDGVTEGRQLVDELAAAKLPLIVSAVARPGRAYTRDDRTDVALGQRDPRNVGALAATGLPVALTAPTTTTTPDLLTLAATVVGYGMPLDRALPAITSAPASILGVGDRLGTLAPGKDADFVLLSGDPLATATRVEKTFIDGQLVYEADPPEPDARPATAILAREVWTGTGEIVRDGMIVCREGKIDSVGPRLETMPAEAEVYDLGDTVLAPGMIDLHSHLGLHWEGEPVRVSPGKATDGPDDVLRRVSPALALAPDDPAFQEVLRRGVTTALVAPRDAGMFCGNAAVVKLSGQSSWLLRERAALKFSVLGDSARLRRVGEVVDLLTKARNYGRNHKRHQHKVSEYDHRKATDRDDELDQPAAPGRNAEQESMALLFEPRLPVLVRADRADEILAALKAFREEFGLDLVILGGREAYRVVEELRRFDVGVAVGPEVLVEDKGRQINNAALLSKAGVRVAFQSDATSGARDLRLAAVYAVRHGMSERDALRALTVWPARMLKLDDRLGALAPGRDADLVVYSGSPLEFTSRVQRVMVGGEWVDKE